MELIIRSEFNNKSILELLQYYHVSKPMIYKLEFNKNLYVNGEFKRFNEILKTGDKLWFAIDAIEINTTVEYKESIDILYEDDDIIILNKPANLLVHEDGNTIDTLANRLSFYYQNNNILSAVRPVHRIDFETTGMVLFAKHFLSHSYLSNIFEERKVLKKYRCLCEGKFAEQVGVIDAKIGRHRHENKQIVSKTGKDAISKYRVINHMNKTSKVEVEINGGRRHQIRVHMASIGHPIVGDVLYGNSKTPGLKLHFYEISFVHPRTLRTFTFQCKESF